MKTDCRHEMIDLDFLPEAFGDTNVMMVTLRLRCRDCGPLRCLGVDDGLSLTRPSTSTSGLVLRLPVVPELEDPEQERLAS